MKAAHARSPARHPAPSGALLAALERPRYEILPLTGITDDVLAHVPLAVKITVTASRRRGLEHTLRVVEGLASCGYDAVPHLSARLMRDREQLEEVMLRLQAADVREVFVIAGDARQQAGEFADATGLLSAMGELRERFREIGISGYPESHQFISPPSCCTSLPCRWPIRPPGSEESTFTPSTSLSARSAGGGSSSRG